MGACMSRSKGRSYAWEKDPRVFIQKMKLLQEEINSLLQRREEECEAYERELMLFALKEADWKKERKKLKDEAKGLRKKLKEKEEKIRMMEDEVDQIIIGKNNIENYEGKSSVNSSGVGNSKSNNSNSVVSLSLIEHMKEERARRDETVEKWKMLYLSIKNELDELIHKTNQGTIYWRAKEEEKMLSEEMQRELKAKEKKIEALKAEIIVMEKDEFKRKREVDILRQSLKIMSSNNKNNGGATLLKGRSKRSFRLNNHKTLPKLAFVK